jgi:putative MATE family efflux protein
VSEVLKVINKSKIRKKIYSMILPIMGENILQMAAGFVSAAMIGNITTMPQELAIGAIGLSDRVTQMIWALFKGITTGAAVFVAQSYGAKDYKKLKKVTQQTLLSCMILVVFFQQLIFWQAPTILRVFNPNPELMNSGVLFIRTVSWGLPFITIMLLVAAVLQGMGNARTPMIIAFIMNGVNLVASYALIYGRLGFPALGIRGAAIAMVMAQFVGATIGIYVLFSRNGVLSSLYGKQFFKIELKEILSVYRVGMPSAFEIMFWQMASAILTVIILTFGEIPLAAHNLGLRAESISYMPAVGFSIAATAFIGQAVGTQDRELGKLYLRELIIGSLVVTIISIFFLIFLPRQVLGLLTNKKEIIDLGAKYLILMGLVQIPQNISGVLNGAMRGAGYTKVPMIVAGVGLWGIRIPLSIILTKIFHMNIVAIWSVMCLDLVVRFILSFVLYKTRDIYNKRLVDTKE